MDLMTRKYIDQKNAESKSYADTQIEEAFDALTATDVPTSDSSTVQAKLTSYASTLDTHTSTLGDHTTQLAAITSAVADIENGAPAAVFATTAALGSDATANTVDGKKRAYVVTADGKWYYWNGSAWTEGGVYQATAIADNTLTPAKTTYYVVGKNLFNAAAVVSGYVYWLAGTINANEAYRSSDWIAIGPGVNVARKYNQMAGFYTSAKVFISGLQFSGLTFTTPANTAYMRVSVLTGDVAAEQVEIGSSSTAYESFRYENTPLIAPQVASGDITEAALADGAVTANKIGNLAVSSGKIAEGAVLSGKIDASFRNQALKFYNEATLLNMFDSSTVTLGYYVSITTGNLVSNAGYWTSDYIPVLPETQYAFSSMWYRAYYDANKTFISGANNQTGPATETTPAGAYYMRLSLGIASLVLDTYRVNQGAVLNPFYAHEYYYDAIKIYDSINLRLLTTTLTEINTYLKPTEYLNLPDTIPAVSGREINVYFDNLVSRDSYKLYDFDVTCALGKQQAERWTAVPGSAGTFAMTINAYNKSNGVLAKTGTTNVIVKAASVGTGANRKVLVIGDSTVATGTITGELLTLFGADAMDITLHGTKGSSTNLHEGISGATAAFFVGATSPFYNAGAFDFADYMTDQGYASMEHVIIDLGINEAVAPTTDAQAVTAAATMVSHLNTMISSIHAFDATIKIGICLTIPASSSQDAFGADYQNGQTRVRYKRNNAILVDALLTAYDGRAAEAIYVVPVHTNLDTVNNMIVETVAVNSRNSTTVVRQRNGVHPAASGYYQIADAMFNYLKSFEA